MNRESCICRVSRSVHDHDPRFMIHRDSRFGTLQHHALVVHVTHCTTTAATTTATTITAAAAAAPPARLLGVLYLLAQALLLGAFAPTHHRGVHQDLLRRLDLRAEEARLGRGGGGGEGRGGLLSHLLRKPLPCTSRMRNCSWIRSNVESLTALEARRCERRNSTSLAVTKADYMRHSTTPTALETVPTDPNRNAMRT
jgi:hypothetical protein